MEIFTIDQYTSNLFEDPATPPSPAYLITLTTAPDIQDTEGIWIPIDESALKDCTLDPEKIKSFQTKEVQTVSYILEALNTKDRRAGSRWGLASG